MDIANSPNRRRLPDVRSSVIHKFNIADHEGYVIVGMFPDGSPGEMFVCMAKEGSTIGGLMDSFAKVVSIALQYGVPLEVLVRKFSHQRFEPSGYTSNQDIRYASSIVDYIFRWMDKQFSHPAPVAPPAVATEPAAVSEAAPADYAALNVKPDATKTFVNQSDAPMCSQCGQSMVRTGACYGCRNCAETSGCG